MLLDTRWRKAYSRSGWVGVHAAWKKAACGPLSSFHAEAPPVQARPDFVGVAMYDVRVLVGIDHTVARSTANGPERVAMLDHRSAKRRPANQ